MEKTVFMKIIDREIPAEIVYEDEHTIAFLDHAPTEFGHTLVIPKKPFVNIFDIDDETLTSVIKTVRKMAPLVRDAVGAKGVHINSNHGHDAGQDVFHLHFHIIPRHSLEDFIFWPKKKYEAGEMASIAKKIREES